MWFVKLSVAVLLVYLFSVHYHNSQGLPYLFAYSEGIGATILTLLLTYLAYHTVKPLTRLVLQS
jgi:hypothetical protein